MEKSIKDLILSEYKKVNIVVCTCDGLCTASISDMINQPVEGILYDLNRDEATILTFIDDPKWINDYALSRVVIELKRRLEIAESSLGCCKN